MIKQPQDLLSGYVEIASPPTIFMRVNDAVNSPRSSIQNVSRIISEDSGLTARLLMLVNSSYFGLPQKVESILIAASMVGTHQLRDLALATSVINMFKGIPVYLVTMDSFWKHAVACGIAARTLAVWRREENPERFFVSGILHDVGRLIMFSKIPDLAREALIAATTKKTFLHIAEKDLVGFDHASVGQAMLQSWNLPDYLSETVGMHHDPVAALHFQQEASVLHIADIIAHALELGTSGEQFIPGLESVAWELLGLDPSVLPAICAQVELQFNDAARIMVR